MGEGEIKREIQGKKMDNRRNTQCLPLKYIYIYIFSFAAIMENFYANRKKPMFTKYQYKVDTITVATRLS